MKRSKHIWVMLFLLLPLCNFAQSGNKTAEDYFNAASERYINNKSTEALKLIYQGLQLDQNNQKLKDLAEIILKKDKNKSQQNKQKQQQQQKQQQGQQQQNKQQQQQKQQQQKQGMKKEDAQRMLDAMKNKEKQTQEKLNRQQEGKKRQIEKDW